ncbi:hypothetical protein CIPAW_06G154200 [Carya illinoinensis]|uniref:Uncharacterized protein n=1 Tax=Carya illinoinensis TaxID=32201 RepID=A0A8T1QBX9_CARIL|nr:hypothetical protein CIPAW_06G154200 [Carya illinoinensis]
MLIISSDTDEPQASLLKKLQNVWTCSQCVFSDKMNGG